MIYALLRLRVEVLVVEQGRPYQELDGLDLHRNTRHYWLAPSDAIEEPQATLRLEEPTRGQFRIGRICAAPQAQRQGGMERLLEAALAEVGDAPCLVDAQLDYVELFTGFGFVVEGAPFTDGGIPRVSMRREATVGATLIEAGAARDRASPNVVRGSLSDYSDVDCPTGGDGFTDDVDIGADGGMSTSALIPVSVYVSGGNAEGERVISIFERVVDAYGFEVAHQEWETYD